MGITFCTPGEKYWKLSRVAEKSEKNGQTNLLNLRSNYFSLRLPKPKTRDLSLSSREEVMMSMKFELGFNWNRVVISSWVVFFLNMVSINGGFRRTFASWIPNVSSDKWIVHVADHSNSDMVLNMIISAVGKGEKLSKQVLEALLPSSKNLQKYKRIISYHCGRVCGSFLVDEPDQTWITFFLIQNKPLFCFADTSQFFAGVHGTVAVLTVAAQLACLPSAFVCSKSGITTFPGLLF